MGFLELGMWSGGLFDWWRMRDGEREMSGEKRTSDRNRMRGVESQRFRVEVLYRVNMEIDDYDEAWRDPSTTITTLNR